MLWLQASQRGGTEKTVKKSSILSYKTPDSRRTAFGGVLRDEDGEVIDEDATESGISSVVQADAPPIDFIVITELSELFDRAVS